MAACRLQCWECGTVFHGRADAHYCSAACRQKSHRARLRRRAADEAVPAPVLGDAIAQARETRESARVVRQRAQDARRAASEARAALTFSSGDPNPGNRPARRASMPD
ncbi:hypothetical protein U8D42_14435 [Mycobacterium europaeum]|uniref:hypothetical protein n=1 Tax=Mycobacterium europaeum TaxID=761804 RepID=UPI002ADFBF9B|nr:hypothetical protein [Mycobacterium europaeum]MEA1160338.1 hypothetical protein [Mycobacterium europaeum]